ncbi:MAG: ATP-binding cassette domain-containing protein, partial [Candidatus Saccharimonadales bacterium]
TQKRIRNLQNDLIRFRRMKEKARDPGTIKRFKGQEEKTEAELEQLSLAEKPSFWIDRESAGDMTPKMADAYQKYKARNIQLTAKTEESRSSRLLVETRQLSLGYGDAPLFQDVNISLHEGERLRLHGRNGACKTTLVNAIMAKVTDTPLQSTLFSGTIAVEKELKLGHYEQEIDAKYLPLKLKDAIEQACLDKDVPASDRRTKQLLSQYLFDPLTDGETPIERLSGGQKARFQLIRMLVDNPLILILDEPTNHLDLPSIEELEDALAQYHCAVIYISHDSIFADKVGGETIEIGSGR